MPDLWFVRYPIVNPLKWIIVGLWLWFGKLTKQVQISIWNTLSHLIVTLDRHAGVMILRETSLQRRCKPQSSKVIQVQDCSLLYYTFIYYLKPYGSRLIIAVTLECKHWSGSHMCLRSVFTSDHINLSYSVTSEIYKLQWIVDWL